MKQYLVILFLIFSLQSFGQQNNCLTVHLKRGSEKSLTNEQFDINDFYLMRNCIYDFVLENEKQYCAKLIDIKKNTIIFTNYFNQAIAQCSNDQLDTIVVNIKDLKTIRLIADRITKAYKNLYLSRYLIEFVDNCHNSSFEIEKIQVFTNDSLKYDVVPYLTYQGYDYLFENNCKMFYYRGQTTKNTPKESDSIYRKRYVVWFTPNEVQEIDGLAIGLFTENLKGEFYGGKDSLKINGLNIELMPFGFVWIMGGTIFNNPEESMEVFDREIKNDIGLKINGANISLSGTISKAKINGLNVAGISTSVGVINGFSVSGFNTFTFISRGINVSIVQNISVKCRGVQIGLFNKSKDFKGLQIGLWNNNGKFSLPIINLRF